LERSKDSPDLPEVVPAVEAEFDSADELLDEPHPAASTAEAVTASAAAHTVFFKIAPALPSAILCHWHALLNVAREGMTPRARSCERRRPRCEKKRDNRGTVEAADNRCGRGRPGHLTPELADAITAQITAGLAPGAAARACGVGERTLRTWRRRAWSSRAADAPFIDLEKRIQRALRKGSPTETAATDWEDAAAFLEHERPERWPARPELDDVLGELE
jgi:hypothetical protein